MRPALLASLVLIGLIGLGMRSHYYPGRTSRVIDLTHSTKKNPEFTAHGYGETDNEAKLDALHEGQGKLIGYLRSLDPPMEWVPSLGYVEHLAKESKPEPVDPKLDLPENLKQWRIKIELTSVNRRDILRKDREYRAHERMLWLGKALGGLVACLAALASYVHLDERTKGYYTNWLRLGAFAFVALVGAGLWCLP